MASKLQVCDSDWESNSVYQNLMLDKTEGKMSWREKKGIFYVIASLFRNISHKTAKISPGVII